MLLLYFMDGLKVDMARQHMPFLSSQKLVPLMSDFGYSCACHATMYTGKYIDEHNTWFVWKRGNNSPYKFLDKIPLLKYINLLPVKYVVSKIARKVSPSRGFSGIPMLVNLPLKYWSLFEPCERQFWTDDDYLGKTDTLFKILRRENVPHHIIALSRGGDVFSEEAQADYKRDDFIYYFIGDVDSYMHKYGENAIESVEYLKRVDRFIEDTYNKAVAARGIENVTILCYSDHGHIDVDKKIDINDYFRPHKMNVNKHVHLIESTFARFWVRNDDERGKIMTVLRDMEDKKLGFVIDKKYMDEYHLNFNSNEHGDIVFHLNAPNIFTNTIWGYGKTIRSMHGYEPTLAKHIGVLASNKNVYLSDGEYAHLTDILPTILGNLHLNTTNVMRGKDLLNEEDKA